MNKPTFIGKDALQKQQALGAGKKFVTLTLNYNQAAAHGGSSVMIGEDVVGTVTSGDWGHRTGLNIAYAFVAPEFANAGTECKIDVLGTMVSAIVIEAGPYDPTLARVRN